MVLEGLANFLMVAFIAFSLGITGAILSGAVEMGSNVPGGWSVTSGAIVAGFTLANGLALTTTLRLWLPDLRPRTIVLGFGSAIAAYGWYTLS